MPPLSSIPFILKSPRFKFLSLSLLIVICITFRANAEKVSIESPVLFGAMLMDKPDVKSMRDVCEYYGFVEQELENGFFVFKDANGTVLRLKDDERTPVIEVVANEKNSIMRKMLVSAGYRKTSKGYVKGSEFAKSQTVCTIKSSPSTLTFTKITKRNI